DCSGVEQVVAIGDVVVGMEAAGLIGQGVELRHAAQGRFAFLLQGLIDEQGTGCPDGGGGTGATGGSPRVLVVDGDIGKGSRGYIGYLAQAIWCGDRVGEIKGFNQDLR